MDKWEVLKWAMEYDLKIRADTIALEPQLAPYFLPTMQTIKNYQQIMTILESDDGGTTENA